MLSRSSNRSNSDNDDTLGKDEGNDLGYGSKRKRSPLHEGNNNYYRPSDEEEDLANCLIMLSNSAVVDHNHKPKDVIESKIFVKAKGPVFECKACKKVFSSHQALGGHRASHKKVKGCYATRLDHQISDEEEEEDRDMIIMNEDEEIFSDKTSSRKRSKGHECSICHRVFSSGQALGGHKRCHWLTPSSSAHEYHPQQMRKQSSPPYNKTKTIDLKLDLNLPSTEFPVEIEEHGNKKTCCKVTLTKLSEAMDVHMRRGGSSSWLQLASGRDWFNY